MLNQDIFRQKISALKSMKQVSVSDVEKFSGVINNLFDWDLFRINPLKFAEVHRFEKSTAVDLFICGTKVGLFDFNYNMICPMCAGIEFSIHSVDEIKKESFYCSTCKIFTPTTLDDQIEVSFTLHPSVKELSVDPYTNIDSFTRFFYSQNYLFPPKLREMFKMITLGFFTIEPGMAKKITLTTRPNTNYVFSSMGNHCIYELKTGNTVSAQKQELVIDLHDGTFSPINNEIEAGEVTVRVKNSTHTKSSIIIRKPDPMKFMEIIQETPVEVTPWLTGKMLLNNQTFREVFKIQTITNDLKLNLRSQTVLFTDLRGSTEMYDKAGDFTAYQMVQEHFDVLIQIVRKYSGAVVKTMGDAIMATFSHPSDGLLASIEMVVKIAELNEIWKLRGYEIGLKVGLHEGSTLAVNVDDRLDYFGQSVNIAARVQGLANAGEIIVTDSVFNFPGVQEVITDKGYEAEMQTATLKGVGQTATVYKIFKAA